MWSSIDLLSPLPGGRGQPNARDPTVPPRRPITATSTAAPETLHVARLAPLRSPSPAGRRRRTSLFASGSAARLPRALASFRAPGACRPPAAHAGRTAGPVPAVGMHGRPTRTRGHHAASLLLLLSCLARASRSIPTPPAPAHSNRRSRRRRRRALGAPACTRCSPPTPRAFTGWLARSGRPARWAGAAVHFPLLSFTTLRSSLVPGPWWPLRCHLFTYVRVGSARRCVSEPA